MSIHTPKITVSLAVLAALGLGAAAFSFGRTQAAPAVATPTAVAVVDIRQAMRLVKEAEATQADLKLKDAEAKKAIETRRNALKGMEERAKLMTRGSAEYNDLDAQFTEGLIQLEGFQKFQQEKLSRFSYLAELSLYRKVCARAAQLAEAKGYDILLDHTFTQDNLEKVPASKAAVEHFINGHRTLLYTRKSVDLTNDLVAVMNNEFNQRGGAPAAQPGPLAPAPTAPLGPIGPTVPAK